MKGIDYFGLQVDIGESDELFDLMESEREAGGEEAAWASFGRLVILLSAIYRQGFALKVTKGNTRRLALETGLDAGGLTDFVGRCIDAGWFDRGLWDSEHVLTSHGIQKRWVAAKVGRSKRKPSIEAADAGYWLLPFDEISITGPGAAQVRRNAAQVRRGAAQSAAKEEEEIEEEIEEEEEDGNVRGAGAAQPFPTQSSSSSSSSSGFPQDVTGDGEPLGCLNQRVTGGTVFMDLDGDPHETQLLALRASFIRATGTPGMAAWRSFAEQMAAECPRNCRAGPDECRNCFGLLMGALAKFDPAKARTPVPIARKILRDERRQM